MCTTKTISEKKLKKQLQKLLVENPNTITASVVEEAFEYHTIKDFFNDLLNHGCVSGMIGRLVFYNQTEKFFDEHYHEIMELKEDFEASTGQPMTIPYHLKNHLAWFGFEQTAYYLVNKIGLEI